MEYLEAGSVEAGLLMLKEGGEAADGITVIGSLLHGAAALQEASEGVWHRL